MQDLQNLEEELKEYISILLNKSEGQLGRDYLNLRKITKATAAEWEMGYCPVGYVPLIYREISKDLDDYVYSDGLQSLSSSTIWRKMFNNTKKYNIKGIKVLKNKKEVDLTSELDIWGFDTEKEHILVGIKF